MLHNVGGVWYERIYPKKFQGNDWKEVSFTTLFQGPVVVEKKVIAVLGFPYNGYIVRRAGMESQDAYQQKMSSPRQFNSYLKTNL